MLAGKAEIMDPPEVTSAPVAQTPSPTAPQGHNISQPFLQPPPVLTDLKGPQAVTCLFWKQTRGACREG
jgi:hypothetical protein